MFGKTFSSLYYSIKIYLHWNWCQMIYDYHCWLSGIALSPSGLYGGDCFAILSRFVGNLWSKNNKHNSINLMATRQFCAFSIFTSEEFFHIKIKLMRLCRIEKKWRRAMEKNFSVNLSKGKTKMSEAAAIAPKSAGWSTNGGKKSVVLTKATSGATW